RVRCPARSRHFPYTTLFRSGAGERRMRMIAAGVLAGTFAVHLADGYFANLIQAMLFLAAAVALATGSMAGAAGAAALLAASALRSEEHTSELQSLAYLVCRL